MQTKKEKMKIAHAEISQKFGQDPPAIFCPSCGVPIQGKGKSNVCPHVLFSYLDIDGGFSTVAPAFKKAIKAIAEDDDIDDPVEAALELFEGKESVFCLTVNFGGMACGPVHYSLTAAFDYSPEKIKRTSKRNNRG